MNIKWNQSIVTEDTYTRNSKKFLQDLFGPFPNKSNRMVMGGIQISKSQI